MRLQLNPDCPTQVRRVRRLILDRHGLEAAVVFSEAVANVREHGIPSEAELSLHHRGFTLTNRLCGPFEPHTEKPTGEGGYGLQILQSLGASLNQVGTNACVEWRRLTTS